MNRAYLQNLVLFVPMVLLWGFAWFFLAQAGHDYEVTRVAQSYLFGSIPHLLFSAIFDIHRHQLNSQSKAYTTMAS